MRSPGLIWCLGAALLIGLGAAPPAAADLADGAVGRVTFVGRDIVSFADVLGAEPTTRTVTLSGDLTLPAAGPARGEAPVPAMVLIPGEAGSDAGSSETYWRGVLLESGLATLVVDSVGPRGGEGAGRDPAALTGDTLTADALAALAALASHPRIDPARIGVMGFSRGGFAAVNAAISAVRTALVDGDPRFAVHLAFYPPCNAQWYNAVTTAAPIVFLLAGADDVTLTRHCENYAGRLRATGGTVMVETFPGSHHGFDTDLPVKKRASVFNASKCMYRISDQGVLFDVNHNNLALISPERRRESYAACGFYGATTGGSGEARAAATARVREILGTTLLRP